MLEIDTICTLMFRSTFKNLEKSVNIFFEIFWIPMTTIRWMTTRGVSVDAMGDGAREMA